MFQSTVFQKRNTLARLDFQLWSVGLYPGLGKKAKGGFC